MQSATPLNVHRMPIPNSSVSWLCVTFNTSLNVILAEMFTCVISVSQDSRERQWMLVILWPASDLTFFVKKDLEKVGAVDPTFFNLVD